MWTNRSRPPMRTAMPAGSPTGKHGTSCWLPAPTGASRLGDPTVSARASQKFCKRTADVGGHITYAEFPALAHDSCARAFEDTNLLVWMLHQHRSALR